MQEMRIIKSAVQTMNTKYCQSLFNQQHVQLSYIFISVAIEWVSEYIYNQCLWIFFWMLELCKDNESPLLL